MVEAGKMRLPIIRIIVLSLMVISVALLYGHFFLNKAYVKIDLESPANSTFKIYWAEKNQTFAEDRSASTRIRRGRHTYLLYIDHLETIRTLRIDPIEKPIQVHIYRLEIKQPHVAPLYFSTPSDFSRLIPVHEIKKIVSRPNGISVVASGTDAQLEVAIHPKLMRNGYYQEIAALLLLVLIGDYIFFRSDQIRRIGVSYVPFLLAFVAALILVMAGLSQYNKHPDEYVHVRAAIYYQDHWMPPKICSPETINTYSVYGVSRLNSHELVYLVAGKFSALLDFLPIPAYIRLRFFNLCLFIILIAVNIKRPKYSLLFVPLLLSPQIWYIFSYFNSDAFSIFIAIIVALQVIRPNSLLNKFLKNTRQKMDWSSCFILGLLFAILFNLKKNFYFFILFILFMVIFKVINKVYQDPKTFIRKAIAVLLISASLIGCRYALDIYVNGLDKTQKISDCREKLAKPAYKPSTSPEKRMPGLYLKSKGVSLKDVLLRYRWGEKSFRSAFGVYGYTSISASTRYYHFPRILGLIFLVFVIWSSFFKTDLQTRQMVISAVICSVLLIGAALWKSWTSDFQAQGRYFFPMIAIFGYLLYYIRGYLKISILNIFVISMCFTSIYSFVFVGLQAIPK